ncbi:hypothetical protein VTH06DRAFT_1347 [Thermothelomyces fergusii]
MPPRRRNPAAGASSASAAAASGAASKSGARLSKLAKENGITAEEEAEIREAFSLFAEPMEGEKEGVMPIGEVRRALIALGIPPTSRAQLAEFTAALDPEDEGFATYEGFVGICALQLHARRDRHGHGHGRGGAAAAEEEEEDEAHRAELDEAYALFVGGRGRGPDAPAITLADLRRVAALLQLDEESQQKLQGGGGGGGQNSIGGLLSGSSKAGRAGKGDVPTVVTDELLRDMILEANDGAGVGKGVTKDQFDRVMRRAGVWRLLGGSNQALPTATTSNPVPRFVRWKLSEHGDAGDVSQLPRRIFWSGGVLDEDTPPLDRRQRKKNDGSSRPGIGPKGRKERRGRAKGMATRHENRGG